MLQYENLIIGKNMKLKYLLVLLVLLGFAVGCDKKESTEKKESKWITP